MTVLKADVENIFGESNVQKWSQMDNDSKFADDHRITLGITYGRDLVNAKFRMSTYAVPMVETGLVTDWIATLAGIWLWRPRGIRDDTEGTRMMGFSEQVNREMDFTLAGMMNLAGQTRTSGHPTAPVGS